MHSISLPASLLAAFPLGICLLHSGFHLRVVHKSNVFALFLSTFASVLTAGHLPQEPEPPSLQT